MKAIFVNERGGIRYAAALAGGYKTIETRSRDMLAACVGERVAVVRTGRGPAAVVGYVTITRKTFCQAADFGDYFCQHLVPPGSTYDATGRGKWFYHVSDADRCDPYPVPPSAIRHGRSWCEW